MRASKIRNGEKFVLEDIGGVWQKIGTDAHGGINARCVFGKKGVFGIEAPIDPSAYVYVIFDDSGKGTCANDGIRVVVGDEDTQKVLFEIKDASASQVATYVSVESLVLRPPYKHKSREYAVCETMYSPDENTLYITVRNTVVLDKEGDRDDNEVPATS